jgi:hypothetical protein
MNTELPTSRVTRMSDRGRQTFPYLTKWKAWRNIKLSSPTLLLKSTNWTNIIMSFHVHFREETIKIMNTCRGHVTVLCFTMLLTIKDSTFYASWLEVSMAVIIKMAVFWVVAPCSLVWVYQHFRSLYCFHHQGALMMEAVQTSEMLVNPYQSTWCYNPKDSNLHFMHCLYCIRTSLSVLLFYKVLT